MSNSSCWVFSIVSCPLLVWALEKERDSELWANLKIGRIDESMPFLSFLFVLFFLSFFGFFCRREAMRVGHPWGMVSWGLSLSQVRVHPPYICPGTKVQYLRSSQQSVFILSIVSLSKWRCSGSCSGHRKVPSGMFPSLIIFTGGFLKCYLDFRPKCQSALWFAGKTGKSVLSHNLK